jgi:hypothetical protein
MGARMSLITAATRLWARLYTAGLARELARSRRDEIDSDLWEMQHDPDHRPRAALQRLLFGIPDDIGWRMDVAASHEQLLTRRFIALTAATVIVVILWAVPTVLLKGRREMLSCAETAQDPRDTAELRHEVLRCAGTFFARRD